MNKVQNLVLEELCMPIKTHYLLLNLITHSDIDNVMILADSVESISRLNAVS